MPLPDPFPSHSQTKRNPAHRSSERNLNPVWMKWDGGTAGGGLGGKKKEEEIKVLIRC